MSLSPQEKKRNAITKVARKFTNKFKSLCQQIKKGRQIGKNSQSQQQTFESTTTSLQSSLEEMPGNSQISYAADLFESQSTSTQRHMDQYIEQSIGAEQLGCIQDDKLTHHLSMKGCRPNRSHPSLLQNADDMFRSAQEELSMQYLNQWIDSGKSELTSHLTDTLLIPKLLQFSKHEKVALLVIDVQRVYFTNSDVIQRAFPQFKSNLKHLIEACRDMNFEIVHIRANYQNSKSPFLTQFHKLNPELPVEVHDIETEEFAKEIEGETVVKKWTWSGFDDTELDDVLKAKGITTVLGCGLVTTRCVHHTMFGAFNKGYRTILISDCCGDRSVERHNTELYLHGDQMYELHKLKDIERLEQKKM